MCLSRKVLLAVHLPCFLFGVVNVKAEQNSEQNDGDGPGDEILIDDRGFPPSFAEWYITASSLHGTNRLQARVILRLRVWKLVQVIRADARGRDRL